MTSFVLANNKNLFFEIKLFLHLRYNVALKKWWNRFALKRLNTGFLKVSKRSFVESQSRNTEMFLYTDVYLDDRLKGNVQNFKCQSKSKNKNKFSDMI